MLLITLSIEVMISRSSTKKREGPTTFPFFRINVLAISLEALLAVDEGCGRVKLFVEDGNVASETGFDLAVVLEAE